MARHGISYEDVIDAANALKGQGKSVTIENVRGFLGTGSSGTVNQHLRRWKEVQQSTQTIASKESLPEGLIALVKGLWESILAQSTEQFTPIETNYQQEISELKTELEKYRGNNQRWQKMFNQWQQEKTALANEKLTLEQALDFTHKENQSLHDKYDGLLQQLQEKQERVDELHRLHQQTQANLEHYRESVQRQQLLHKQQFEEEKHQFLIEVKKLKEQLIDQQVTYSEMYQKNQLRERIYTELEDKYIKSESLIESFKKHIQQLEKSNMEYQQASQHWCNQFNDSKRSFEIKITEIITLQSDNKLLTQQFIDIKDSLQNMQAQNKLLACEKLELVQMKAQLEGQLKQMHSIFPVKNT
jgi:chromosome segregation ATPase